MDENKVTQLGLRGEEREEERVEYKIGNQLGDVGAEILANWLRDNLTVTTLDLGSNGITVPGAAAIGDALRTNKKLTALSLAGEPIRCNSTVDGQDDAWEDTEDVNRKRWNRRVWGEEDCRESIVQSNHHLPRIGRKGDIAPDEGDIGETQTTEPERESHRLAAVGRISGTSFL